MTHLAKICILVFISLITLISCRELPKQDEKYRYSHSPIKGAWSSEDGAHNETIYFLSDGRFRQIATYEEDGVEYLLYDHQGVFNLSNDTLTLDKNREFIISFEEDKLYMHGASCRLIYSRKKPF